MLHCGFYNRKICLYIAGLQRVIGIWRKKKRDFFLFSQCTDRVCFCPWICSTVKCNAAGTDDKELDLVIDAAIDRVLSRMTA